MSSSGVLKILRAGPAMTIQDSGRPGHIGKGLSRGGAADPQALREASALLGCKAEAIEMAGFGGTFEVSHSTRIALTGAPMRASVNGAPVTWSAVHSLGPGDLLEIGAVQAGVYGYLTPAGGVLSDEVMHSRSAHLVAGIGGLLKAGDALRIGADPGGETGVCLPVADRFSGGVIRLVASAQTALFDASDLDVMTLTSFTRAPRGNRQGIALDGGRITVPDGLTLVSETIAPGDIQITGDGTPYILMAECQTMGGYPRIATVIAPDMPKVAQAGPGVEMRFEILEQSAALDVLARDRAQRACLADQVVPILRDPRKMTDLLEYSLISGAVTGWEE